MLYNNEILPTLTVESSPRSLNILLSKLLSLRRREYLAVDRELKIKEISVKVQDFADIHEEVGRRKKPPDCLGWIAGANTFLQDPDHGWQLMGHWRTTYYATPSYNKFVRRQH
jgi:hypothetical protein